MVVSAPSFLDHPEIVPVPNQDGVRHSQEQPGSHDARNRTDVTFQSSRICNRLDAAIENVIAVVRHEQATPLNVGDRLVAKFAQSVHKGTDPLGLTGTRAGA